MATVMARRRKRRKRRTRKRRIKPLDEVFFLLLCKLLAIHTERHAAGQASLPLVLKGLVLLHNVHFFNK